jgi:hypothetical protein
MFKKRRIYKATAKEKSMLIIFNEQMTYGIPPRADDVSHNVHHFSYLSASAN